MPIEFGCPCGKTLRVRDELAGERVKCPVCGEIRSVPLDSLAVFVDDDDDSAVASAPAESPATRTPKRSHEPQRADKKAAKSIRPGDVTVEDTDNAKQKTDRRRADKSLDTKPTLDAKPKANRSATTRVEVPSGQSIIGKPVDTIFRILVPSMFGHTLLRIGETKLVEETQRAGSFRHSEFHLDEVTGAEIRVTRNRGLLMCGLMTLPIGIGLVPLIAYLFDRYRLLVIYFRSSNTLTVSIQSLEEEAYAFVESLLLRRVPTKSDD